MKITSVIAQTYPYAYTNFSPFIWTFIIKYELYHFY